MKGAEVPPEATRELQGALAELEGTAPSGRREAGEIEAELRGYLADWQGLLRGQTVQARQMIRKLLDRALCFHARRGRPTERSTRTRGAWTGCSSIRGDSACCRAMVTPAGFEPAISTLKGSRPWPG